MRLDSAFGNLDTRLDSLLKDSLNARISGRIDYERLLNEAKTARDNTKVRLKDLRVSVEGVTPEIWERLRGNAEMSIDSLRRLFISADSAHKLQDAASGR
jgi:hypothetical protein